MSYCNEVFEMKDGSDSDIEIIDSSKRAGAYMIPEAEDIGMDFEIHFEMFHNVGGQLHHNQAVESCTEKQPFAATTTSEQKEVSVSQLKPESLLSYFGKYISKELFEGMAYHTNLHAEQTLAGAIGIKNRDVWKKRNAKNVPTKFQNTNIDEIKSLVGVHVIIETLKFKRLDLYWDSVISVESIRAAMSRTRFSDLRKHLCLVNLLEIPTNNTDALFAVRPIFNAVQRRCSELPLENCLSIDEQLLPFKDCTALKLLMPNGMRMFMLCGKSGIIFKTLIYQDFSKDVEHALIEEYGWRASVVLNLTQNVPPGFFVSFDKSFTTDKLLDALREKKINAVGEACIARYGQLPFSKESEFRKNLRGYCEQVLNGNIVFTKWFDNKQVLVASNYVGIGHGDTVQRWSRSINRYVDTFRPEAIRVYNENMAGCDKLNHLMSLYRFDSRACKWELHMIFQAVEVALINSWQEYVTDCKSAGYPKRDIMDYVHFRLRVAEDLIYLKSAVSLTERAGLCSTRQELQPAIKVQTANEQTSQNISTDQVGHLPEFDMDRKYRLCQMPGCTLKTLVYCSKCRIHLCFLPKTIRSHFVHVYYAGLPTLAPNI